MFQQLFQPVVETNSPKDIYAGGFIYISFFLLNYDFKSIIHLTRLASFLLCSILHSCGYASSFSCHSLEKKEKKNCTSDQDSAQHLSDHLCAAQRLILSISLCVFPTRGLVITRTRSCSQPTTTPPPTLSSLWLSAGLDWLLRPH